MRILLRIDADEDTAEDLVTEWLHGPGNVVITTPIATHKARLTYVKEQ